MRIEPTAKLHQRQPSNRRGRSDAAIPVNTRDKKQAADDTSIHRNQASVTDMKSRQIISLDAPNPEAARPVSSKRWRSYTPFVAQYIGQETAIESPERYTRCHSEIARETYKKQSCRPPLPRTIAHI